MEIKHLFFSYEKTPILSNINLKFKRGAVTTLMGANGCGKSTLLNLMSRNLEPDSGRIYLNRKSIEEYKNKEFARELGMVYQQNRILGDITVKKLVSYGRTPYLKPLQKYSEEDLERIDFALEMTNLKSIQEKEVAKLSGGQRQRVFIAMALAQNSNILLLDEPTTYLDVKYQMDILNLVRKINKDLGITIIMVLHDIMQAINYSDEVIGLQKGKIVFQGAPKEVLSSEIISELYDTHLIIEEFRDSVVVLPKHMAK
ncbi:MAG: ABC transporter ATP-binding protein [Bacillota bacterium]|nr:ABC transporter ATP-binding protein [Bacillota bacterium]